MLRAGGRWSGDVLQADYEDQQDSKAAKNYVTSFSGQEIFVKELYEFLRANGTLLPTTVTNGRRKTSSKKVIMKSRTGGRKREDLAKIRCPRAEMSLTDIMKDLE